MSLRIAFDLDGTVADMLSALGREADVLFGPESGRRPADAAGEVPADVPEREPATVAATIDDLHLTEGQRRQLWDRVKGIEDFWTTLPELEAGIIERLGRIADQRRWEVLFITARPATAGDTPQRQSQRWLEQHGFRLPSVYVVPRSRGRLAAVLGLDAVVDDRPEHVVEVAADSQARPFLVWPGPRKVPSEIRRLGIQVLPSIGEAVKALERMDESRRQSPVMRSIRRMFRRD